jgi:hypothetical protein
MQRLLPTLVLLPVTCYLLLVTFTNPTLAAEEFSTSIISTYTVNESGTTDVDIRVTLTNNSDKLYPKEYKLALAAVEIEDIKARDNQGNILKDYKHQEDITYLYLKFNDKAIGIGNTLTFRISYTSGQIAQKKGNIWEIRIPALPESDNLENYIALLKTPQNFPENVTFKPQPDIVRNREYIWRGEQLKNSSASAFFEEPIDNAHAQDYNSPNTPWQIKIYPLFLGVLFTGGVLTLGYFIARRKS